jgi:hypothetical protein
MNLRSTRKQEEEEQEAFEIPSQPSVEDRKVLDQEDESVASEEALSVEAPKQFKLFVNIVDAPLRLEDAKLTLASQIADLNKRKVPIYPEQFDIPENFNDLSDTRSEETYDHLPILVSIFEKQDLYVGPQMCWAFAWNTKHTARSSTTGYGDLIWLSTLRIMANESAQQLELQDIVDRLHSQIKSDMLQKSCTLMIWLGGLEKPQKKALSPQDDRLIVSSPCISQSLPFESPIDSAPVIQAAVPVAINRPSEHMISDEERQIKLKVVFGTKQCGQQVYADVKNPTKIVTVMSSDFPMSHEYLGTLIRSIQDSDGLYLLKSEEFNVRDHSIYEVKGPEDCAFGGKKSKNVYMCDSALKATQQITVSANCAVKYFVVGTDNMRDDLSGASVGTGLVLAAVDLVHQHAFATAVADCKYSFDQKSNKGGESNPLLHCDNLLSTIKRERHEQIDELFSHAYSPQIQERLQALYKNGSDATKITQAINREVKTLGKDKVKQILRKLRDPASPELKEDDRDVARSRSSDSSSARSNDHSQDRRSRSRDRRSSRSHHGRSKRSRKECSSRSSHGEKRSRPGHRLSKHSDRHPHHHRRHRSRDRYRDSGHHY